MPGSTVGRPAGFPLRAFAIIHPYWTRSGDRRAAWALLLAILGLTLGLVWINVQYNYWNRNFFNALEAKDTGAFWRLIPYFFALSAATVAGGAMQTWLTQKLQMRWRVWLTEHYLDAWLARQTYYQLEQDPRGTDNPDQRIAEDLKLITQSTLELSLGLLHNTVTLVTFIAILWSVSAPITLALAGSGVSIPGDMVWAALAYAVTGSAATYLVGRPLIALKFQQERHEADMRYGLMRTREYAEGIALYRGERSERVAIDERIGRLVENWRRIMATTFQLGALSGVYTQLGILLPYFLTSPRYFSGAITLGVLTQTAGAFDTVRVALSWFVFNYQSLASWKASVDRLLTFDAAMAGAKATPAGDDRIEHLPASEADLRAEGLELRLPNGTLLVALAKLHMQRGDRVLVRGAPGSGKSTLMRALAGIWRHGRGTIRLPSGTLFLPQKPYIPHGRLADAVAYPLVPGSIPDHDVRRALDAVGLPALCDRLGENGSWSQMLSGGEQQKLAIARALLVKPDWLFLDEATSALDEESEASLYRLLRDALPDAALISVAHRAILSAFHERTLMLGVAESSGRERSIV